MCGIVGAVSQTNITSLLVNGLQHLEYRGYDSAGVGVIDNATKQLVRVRCTGKVKELETALATNYPSLEAHIGIAHTRWATHGAPLEMNAHPHVSNNIILVHNGIIENHDKLRTFLSGNGYTFTSHTDTEVIAHLISYLRTNTYRLVPEFGSHALDRLQNKFMSQLEAEHVDLLIAVQMAVCVLEGAYGMAVYDITEPQQIIAARSGSPLVIGVGSDGHYLASDQLAIIEKTNQFIYLEEGDTALIREQEVQIYDNHFEQAERPIIVSNMSKEATDKGDFAHFMLKEIFEQPQAILDSLEGRITNDSVLVQAIGNGAQEILDKVEHIVIVACGTSYHSGLVAKYWLEDLCQIPCEVEIASEFRYRSTVTRPNSLIITLSQSGETADTLAALRKAKASGFIASMTISNSPESSIVRESDFAYITRCGKEIGVASTKAFTSQLVLLLLFTLALGRAKSVIEPNRIKDIIDAVKSIPHALSVVLNDHESLKELAQAHYEMNHCLFIARDSLYPIVMEADLKLKEISYIHSQSFAGGELKHGPLALVEANMPVFALAPTNVLLDKIKSNIEEVLARKGHVIIFTDSNAAQDFARMENTTIIKFDSVGVIHPIVAPIFHILPFQLFSYYVAVLRGCDVDKPRNLAKSVTVE